MFQNIIIKLFLINFIKIVYTSSSKCEDGYVIFENICYKKHNIVSVNRTDAATLCNDEESSFPIIHHFGTNEFLKSFAGNSFWIDLQCYNDSNCSWSDQSPYDFNNFQNYKANTLVGNYVYIQHNPSHTNFYGIWMSAEENFLAGSVICTKVANFHNQDCPPDYQYISIDNSNCYKYVNIQRNFSDSYNDCTSDTGNLVSIHSLKENLDIIEFVNKNQNEKSIWIGLTYNISQDVSQWIDNTNLTFTNYKQGFPSKYFGDVFEMLVVNDIDALGYWLNTNSENKLPYVCMMTADEVSNYWKNKFTTQKPIEVNTLSPEGQCPQNNFYQNNGTISSPAYPSFYGNDVSCDYYLIMTNHSLVQFKIIDLYIGEDDILQVYEGNYIKLLKEFTGFNNHDAIGEVISTSKEYSMVLSFKSSNKHLSMYRGFVGNFEMYDPTITTTNIPLTTLPSTIDQTNNTSCPNNIFTDASAQVESPGYPNPYGENLICYYIIKVSETKRIALNIIEHHFSLNGVELYVYNGQGETNDKILEITKDDNNNGTLMALSKSNVVTVVFYTTENPGIIGDKWLFWYRTF
ncbi:CUB domain and C-type lectin domain and C-type lectin-like domain and C-type lectin fold domain-containing protein [Strongyloides ratti]|uniref:CUB domain and C-type lectin domain and C-type lectin-like domain and C-type lectin fold domain-containing protein n=1 Tax=Strongyloides ratti TaxID=34506 RepID=A0A090MWP3_STRRB|nr:CUB domain and C-type lectin domain and C-type lectin-like domain and C-type lectin fold domain-containing protein [Strongyloides ratti]CEF64034.1 CUB domain and C-type lectin domain and C-type lectin-like domain and C-type lectin fold domain-containing protein [Strongyloides ratti]